ncbi:hypothetical protein [Rhodococcus sp. SGAir0479]|uniref:hypothetical protein n=1 Tax=Rhodococcus sp. SGAir0479 TaxID=2567884 RepID=UPI0010CD00C4|nr:hypothetical protein [Rhodococcus sp. SGAir0479]QCQ91175.1 hypothetical protein E7742_07935 [Rhodococcus sp. SGAir0479]
MADSGSKNRGIDYPPCALRNFTATAYEWIDYLEFTRDPAEFVVDVDGYLAIARQRFADAGWNGDGDIQLMWVPPFVLPERSQVMHSAGVILWHVKQESDGTSWLLYPPGQWRW